MLFKFHKQSDGMIRERIPLNKTCGVKIIIYHIGASSKLADNKKKYF
jgi:hypothetical protein